MSLDHGTLNVPLAKRGDINAQLDEYKAGQASEAKREAKARATATKELRVRAKAIVAAMSKERFAELAAKCNTTPADVRAVMKSNAHLAPEWVIKAEGGGMKELQTRRAYLGAQNDAQFIIHAEAPAKSNDYPRHDADRVAIARVLDEEACRRLVACWNACENVSTGDLEAMKRSADLSWVMTIDILVRQRDGLRAAAQSLVDQVARGDFDHIGADHPSSAVHSVRTAIAWAEGGVA